MISFLLEHIFNFEKYQFMVKCKWLDFIAVLPVDGAVFTLKFCRLNEQKKTQPNIVGCLGVLSVHQHFSVKSAKSM